jgi:hypothetical protein
MIKEDAHLIVGDLRWHVRPEACQVADQAGLALLRNPLDELKAFSLWHLRPSPLAVQRASWLRFIPDKRIMGI